MTKHKKVEWLIRVQELRDLLADQRIRPDDWISINARYIFKIKRFPGVSLSLVATLNYRIGRYMWFLANIKILESPILAQGAMGLWDWGA